MVYIKNLYRITERPKDFLRYLECKEDTICQNLTAVDFDQEVSDLEKCTKLSAPSVRRNAKFLSNQSKANQFTARTAS